jgi:carboxymethylenebutenolidase
VPLSLHFGGDDSSVPMEEVHAIEAALAGKPNVEIVVYPGVEHGFTQPDDPRYDRDATERAETSAVAMFSRFLQ